MRFITSIFMLLTATSAVISAYFIGHGIVSEHTWPWLTAAALLGAAVLFGFVYFQLSKRDPQPAGHGHAHAPGHAHTHADGTVHTHPHDAPGHTHH